MMSGAFAAHFATVSGTTLPSTIGRSKKCGGWCGFGDHAAPETSIALVRKSAAAISSSVVTFAARSIASRFGVREAPRQQGFIAYKLENTFGYFMPIRIVP